jgi:hypothetical protein
MYYEDLISEEEHSLQMEVREFVREQVPHDLLRALDRDEHVHRKMDHEPETQAIGHPVVFPIHSLTIL